MRRSRDLQSAADMVDAQALVKQLLHGVGLANDLFGSVAFALHGASPGKVWPKGKLS